MNILVQFEQELAARLAAHEQRISALEARPTNLASVKKLTTEYATQAEILAHFPLSLSKLQQLRKDGLIQWKRQGERKVLILVTSVEGYLEQL
ncbi:MAG: hypothetical protein AAGG68_14785 [Bacteroidota bacterium]